MKIVITGASGLIGSYLTSYFSQQNHDIYFLTRNKVKAQSSPNWIYWNSSNNEIEFEKLEGVQVIIHLAGASISARWTDDYKNTLRSSRIDSTRLICRSIAKLKSPPKVFISASAIGYYGNHGPEKELTEIDKPGQDFLAKLCWDWENETSSLNNIGVRVINLRTGIVLSNKGGALAKMLPIFNLGIGGVLGSGQQIMSWIALAEIPHVIEHVLNHSQISGPINLVSPKPVSNGIFTKELGEVIHRAVFLPVPSFGIKLLFGEMGQTLLLEGAKVIPRKLLDSGYVFRYDDLKLALTAALKS